MIVPSSKKARARALRFVCDVRRRAIVAPVVLAVLALACGDDAPTTGGAVGDDTDFSADGASDVGADPDASEVDADTEPDGDTADVDAASDADAISDADAAADADAASDTDVTPDADPDVAPDADPDVAPDADPDVAPDADPDVAPDADSDVAPDAEPDVAPDADPDVVPDAGPDVPPPVCGDGLRGGDEICDDGNTVDEVECAYGTAECEWCSSDCASVLTLTGPFCGDAVIDEVYEACDGAPAFGCDALGFDAGETECRSCEMFTDDCHTSVCGDGVAEGDEACDDGNTVDEVECAYGTAECEWCSADCGAVLALAGAHCGDDIVEAEVEECDGEPVFTCESLGFSLGETACVGCEMMSAECRDPRCGDGAIEGAEECDDSNTADGDGCSSDCLLEGDRYEGWVAYVSVVGSGLDRVMVIAGDRSEGPYTLPAAGRFSIARQPSFAFDGSAVFYSLLSSTGPSIRRFTLADGSVDDFFDTGFTALRFPQLSPDGTTLLFSAKTEETEIVWNIYTAPLDGSAPPTALTSVTDEESATLFVSAGAWSCDGSEVFYLSGRPGESGTSDLWVMGADGSAPEQITTRLGATSVVPAVRPDCAAVLVDRRLGSLPARVDVETGTTTSFGLASSDSNCSYYGETSFVVCERETGPGPEFDPCTVGGAECVRDIIVLDLDTETTLRNLTQSIGARETLPVASFQPYRDLPLVPPPEE